LGRVRSAAPRAPVADVAATSRATASGSDVGTPRASPRARAHARVMRARGPRIIIK